MKKRAEALAECRLQADTDERGDYPGFDRQSSAAHPLRLARCDSDDPDLRVVGETGAGAEAVRMTWPTPLAGLAR